MRRKILLPFLTTAFILFLGSNGMAQISNSTEVLKSKGTTRQITRSIIGLMPDMTNLNLRVELIK